MESLLKDLGFTWRFVSRRPAFCAVLVLSLALAIGANTAIFSLVNAVLLGTVPVEEPERVVALYTVDEKNPGHHPSSDLNTRDIAEQASDLLDVTYFTFMQGEIEDGEGAHPSGGMLVTSNYFEVLGVEPILGRGFDHDDDALGAHPEVVLSHDLWRKRYGEDPGVLGTRIEINDATLTVVGVAPEGFGGTALFNAEFFVPYSSHRELMPTAPFYENRRWLAFFPVARMSSGTTIEQVDAELKRIGARLAAQYPEQNKGRSFASVPLAHAIVGPDQRDELVMASTVLMTVVGFILLIACANAANLLLARATNRRSEMAVRRIMGASTLRIFRQLITESLVLSIAAAILGLLIAIPLRDFIWSLRPHGFALGGIQPEIDGRVLLFTGTVAIVTGLLFGSVPAWRTARVDLVTPLKEDTTPTTSGGGRGGIRNALVVAQVALSMIALIGAGLFIHSMRNAREVDPGFSTSGLVIGFLDLQKLEGGEAAGTTARRELLSALEAMPEVDSAALATRAPMGAGLMKRTTYVEGRDADAEDGVLIDTVTVSPDYFETIGQSLLEGRDIEETDVLGKPRVVVVNEAFADRYWPRGGAEGHRLRFIGEDEPLTIIGVVATAKLFNPTEDPTPAIYVPLAQWPAPVVHLHVAGPDAAGLGPTIEQKIESLGRRMTLTDIEPIEAVLEDALFAPRAGALLLGSFGALALGLAAIGIYGIMSYSIEQRTREIGIRVALGARPSDVMRFVLFQAMTSVVLGVGIGVAGGLFLQGRLGALLFEVPFADPLAYGGATVVLVVIALVAGYIPARRATTINPSAAIRHD